MLEEFRVSDNSSHINLLVNQYYNMTLFTLNLQDFCYKTYILMKMIAFELIAHDMLHFKAIFLNV